MIDCFLSFVVIVIFLFYLVVTVSQPNRTANRKKHHCPHCCRCDNYSSKANLLSPSPALKHDSCASPGSPGSNASPIPPTLDIFFFNNNLVGEFTTSPAVQSFIDSSDASKSCPLSIIELDAPRSSYQTKIGSDAFNGSLPSKAVSSSSPQNPDIISLVQSDVNLSASTSSFPSKAMSSSSPQRTDAVSFVQSDVKSNNHTSSLPKKTVSYSSPLKPDVVSLPHKFITKTGTVSSMQWVVKSKTSKSSLASKPMPAVAPTPKADSSPICSTKETITSPFIPSDADSNASKNFVPSDVESNAPGSSYPTKIGSEASDSSLLCNPKPKVVPRRKKNKWVPSKQSDVKLNISPAGSFPLKEVSSSSPQRVDTVSLVQSDVKSNTSTSSLPPTPKAAPSPICSTKATITSSIIPADADSNASKTFIPSDVESNAPGSSHPTKIGSEASDSSLLCNPKPKVVPRRKKNKPVPSEQSDVKLNISPAGSFPLKEVSSSSPQRVDTLSLVQSDVKSNTSTSSLPPTQKAAPSPICSTKATITSSIIPADADSNASKTFIPSDVESNTPGSSHPTKTGSEASDNSLLCNPKPKVLPRRKKNKPHSEQPNVKLSISTSSFPPKDVSSSSPQRVDTVSFVQSDVKSNTSTSSLPPTQKAAPSPICSTKATITSSIIPSDADSNASKTFVHSDVESNAPGSSHPTKIGSEASDSSLLCNPKPKVVPRRKKNKSVPSEQSDVKLNISPAGSFSLKEVSSSSPQRVDTVSLVQSNVKSNTSTRSLPTETVLSSSPLNPHAVSLPNKFHTVAPSMKLVVKSKTSQSSLPSKPIAAVSPTPKSASSPNCSTKKTITFPFVQSNAELNFWKTAALSKMPLSNAGPGSSNSASSTNSSSSTSSVSSPKKVRKGEKKQYAVEIPLSPDTYADYFAALLYADDIYCEKWSGYLLEDVPIKLRMRGNPRLKVQSDKKKSTKSSDSETQKNYPFVVFEINEVPERRPFLLSRDHVHLRPTDKSKKFQPFHGVLVRVQKGQTILAEFEDDFHKQHEQSKRYDVSFSFNRICLKRAHRAVSAAANPVLRKILFPNPTSLPTPRDQVPLMDQILNHKLAPIPYLIEGPLSQRTNTSLRNQRLCRSTRPVRECTNMLFLIKDIVLKIYESREESRVLICAAQNSACDALVKLMMEKVCEFDIFRANAAFRDKEEVPEDIMPACLFQEECFTCPPLDELKSYRIITSTFVSTFRLYKAGLKAGHFSHIFLVDASSVIEPEMIVALVDLVSEETVVVVTGSAKDKPYWIRSDIGRKHGLRKSFFERLIKSEPYRSGNPLFITRIKA